MLYIKMKMLITFVVFCVSYFCQCDILNNTTALFMSNPSSGVNFNEQPYNHRKRRATSNRRRDDQFIWTRYNRYLAMMRQLEKLALENPDFIHLKRIGRSAENRTLAVIVIGNANAQRTIWIDGGIHAREWISPATVMLIVRSLVVSWSSLPSYMKNLAWHILPLANPDGYEYSHTKDRFWRKNRRKIGRCYGVDLNRNFNFKWGYAGASTNPCDETYQGPNPFSEPETYAMSQYMLGIKPKPISYLSYHSYGQYILYPFGYAKKQTADAAVLKSVGASAASKIRKMTSARYTVAPSHIIGAASGASDDWAKVILGAKYTYTVELRDSGFYGFRLPSRQIRSAGREGWIVASTVARAVAEQYH